MSSAGLVARAVLSMDNTSLVGAAGESVAALDAVKSSAQQAGAAGAEMGAGLDAARAATDGLTQSATLSAAAISASADAKAGEIAKLSAIANANTSVTATVSTLSAAQSAYNAEVNQARSLLAAGLINQEAYGSAVEGATAKLAIARAMADQGSAALREQAAAAAAIGMGLRGLGQDAEDATEHASHLTGELGHLGRAVGVSREQVEVFRGAFKIFPELVEAIGPAGLAMLALAVVIGVVVAAETAWEAKSNKLLDAVDANGVAAGKTYAQIQDVANKMADVAHTTEAAATSLATVFARSGIDPNYYNDLADAANRYAIAQGMTLPDAAKKFADALRDPKQLAEELNERYQLLNGTQLDNIARLQALGDKNGALDIVLKAVNSTLTVTQERTTLMGKAWDDAKSSVSDFFADVGKQVNEWMPYILAARKALSDTGFDWGTYVEWLKKYQDESTKLQQSTSATIDKVKQQANADSAAIRQVADGLDPFKQQLAEIDAKISQQTDIINRNGVSENDLAQAKKNIIELHKQRSQVVTEETQHLQFLTAADKQNANQYKETTDRLHEAINSQTAQNTILQQQVDAVGTSAFQQKVYNQQLETTKALAPFVEKASELAKSGHMGEANALQVLIQKYKEARDAGDLLINQKDGMAELQQKFVSLDGTFANVAVQYQQQVKAAKQWQHDMEEALGGIDTMTDEQLTEIDAIFKDTIDKAYVDSLQKAKDWASGVALAMHNAHTEEANYAKQSSDLSKQVSDEFEQGWVDAITGSKDALQNFLMFFEQLLAKMIYEKFLAAQMNDLAGAMVNGLGDLFGFSSGGTTVGAMHAGGTVGETTTFSRMVPISAFADAPRFHTGISRVPYFRPGEVPTILQEGERVYTEAQAHSIDAALMRPMMMQLPAGSSSGGPAGDLGQIKVTVHNLDGQTSSAQTTRRPDGGLDIDVLVDRVDQAFAQRVHKGKGQFVKTMTTTFNLKRATS